MKTNTCIKIILIVAISVISNFAIAANHDHDHDHDSDSQFYGHLDVRVHYDIITEAEEDVEKFNEAYSHSHLELGAKVDQKFSINTNIKLEGEAFGHSHGGGGSSADGDDRYFEEHPLLVEKLTLNYKGENFSTYIGKFNPIVGIGYHSVPGVYGYSLIEEYAIREKLGLGGSIDFEANYYGSHSLDFSTFYADTSFLSDSRIHQRGQTQKSDGGVANTGDLSSFAVSLGGSNFYSISNNNIVEGLSYRIGYAHQEKGVTNEENEERYAASLGYKYQISGDLSSRLITEYIDIEHLGGEAGHDRSFYTTALKLDFKEWHLGTSYTHIRNDAEEEDESHNGHVYQISAGLMLNDVVGVDFGYKYSDRETEVKERIGVMISYEYGL